MNHEQATRGVVTVGDGRGVIVEGKLHRNGERDRLVITADYCLTAERTSNYLSGFDSVKSVKGCINPTWKIMTKLGPLGESPSIWAECLFVDRVGNIAVLGAPDSQWIKSRERYEEATYDVLMDAMMPLPVANAPSEGAAWLLSLDGKWFPCRVQYSGRALWVSDAIEGIMNGMSGSPILAKDGQAIGVCVASGGLPGEKHTEGGPHPTLADDLPGWCLREIGISTNSPAD